MFVCQNVDLLFVVGGLKSAFLYVFAHTLASKMRKITGDDSLGFAHLSSRWTSLLEAYEGGKIKERFFSMFSPRSK
ncbi:MAG: hypothetical protein AYK18_02575 [Theionarchaea archaeon DG-70]|nr:MAG: hypothetical protein AYK18_02575 [Theionarchaea archaeon DG-70]